MSIDLFAVCFDAIDPPRVARFWSGLLGWEPADERGQPTGVATLLPGDDTGFRLRFVATDEPKTRQNLAHFDLTSNLEEQDRIVARALALGATHADVGQKGDEGHVVLADPEGNEFDVIEPGNNFLADCGFIGALACDGSQREGYFWSAALGWPLVWDENEETAIRSPRGGPKITWGGPPNAVRPPQDRVRLELAADDRQAETDRLIGLGATLVDGDTLADPDGNHFRLL